MPQSGQDAGPLYLQGKPLGTFQGDVFQLDQQSGQTLAFQQSGSIYELAPISGIATFIAPQAHVIYDSNQQGYQGNQAAFGQLDQVPMFIFMGGNVVFARDRAGNLIAGNPDKPFGAQ